MEFDWHCFCNVAKAGAAEDGNVYIDVVVHDNEGKLTFHGWLVADRNQASRMLSVALTAITTGYEVEMALQKDTGLKMYNTISRLYLHHGPGFGYPV